MYFDVVNHFYFSLECTYFLNRGLNVKIFPLSDLILLPLTPTIARTIADYLHSITQSPDINAFQPDCVAVVTELSRAFYWQWEFQKSIRQIPTLQYQYVSTIAHQLAAKSSLTRLEICQNLHIPIPDLSIIEGSVCMELYCWYNEAGYIYFQFTPQSIEIWLNYIHDLPIVDVSPPEHLLILDDNSHSIGSSGKIDLAIYAHARCCSLLKLAESEKLVAITANWQISTSEWLLNPARLDNPLTTHSNCIFEHPVEQKLIHALMEVLDVIYSHNGQLESSQSESNVQMSQGTFHGHRKSPNWTKLTIDLAQSWLEFDRYCQIFGDLNRQNPRLVIARCVLTAISRRYLQVLLEDRGVTVLMEL
jgi:hypothetical protein